MKIFKLYGIRGIGKLFMVLATKAICGPEQNTFETIIDTREYPDHGKT